MKSWLPWAGLAVALGCSAPPPPNVLLVVVDTLRADALGVSGGPVPTPNFDTLAHGGVRFVRAYAPAPSTAPSHATLFTGQAVLRHGLERNGDSLRDDLDTLAERFQRAGYRTGAFVSSFVLDPRFGWSQGFDEYDARLEAGDSTLARKTYPGAFWEDHRFEGFDRPGATTTDAAIAWMEGADEPFFAFVHLFDPHAPYGPPEGYLERVPPGRIDLEGRSVPGVSESVLRGVVRKYHAEVLYVDDLLGRLATAVLERSDRPTLIVITADHGEGLGQHDWLEHALHLYDEQVRIPLLLHYPGTLPPNHQVQVPVALEDVAPTVAELAGLPPTDEPSDGRSLVTAAKGEPLELRPILGIRQLVSEEAGWDRGTEYFIRQGRYKFIDVEEGPDELYDLAADPGELHNLIEERSRAALILQGVIDSWRSSMPLHPPPKALTLEERQALEALGYVESESESPKPAP